MVTKTQLVYKQSDVETRSFNFGEIENFTLDQEKINGWMNSAVGLVIPVVYPACVLWSYACRIVQVLIYAAIGLLFAYWCNSQRSYGSLVRLAVVAITPCIILKTILWALPITIPVSGLWYFLIAMGYLFVAVRAAAEGDEPPAIHPGTEFHGASVKIDPPQSPEG